MAPSPPTVPVSSSPARNRAGTVELNVVRKCYDDFVAVDNISFSIQPGKIYGLLGPNGAGAGVLTTESGLIFTGDALGNVLALRTSDGKTLWHAGAGSPMQSSPITYELDGRQYVVTSAGGVLFSWALPQ